MADVASKVESPVATAVASAKPKVKKTAAAKPKSDAAKKAPRPKANHPATADMVNSAIGTLKERGGSSLQAIKKYMVVNYQIDAERLAPFIKKYLRSAVTNGGLIQVKGKGASGSFKLPVTTKKIKATTKSGEKKVVKKVKTSDKKKAPKSPKKKSVAKKAASPKKAVEKKKPVVKAAVVAVAKKTKAPKEKVAKKAPIKIAAKKPKTAAKPKKVTASASPKKAAAPAKKAAAKK